MIFLLVVYFATMEEKYEISPTKKDAVHRGDTFGATLREIDSFVSALPSKGLLQIFHWLDNLVFKTLIMSI
ncbi:MAG: hypothetical protein ONB46_01690 [candidate division KSB1 bacterium]|nr:hypothetical protein [candidate division KSB1 bacterium]MDZ7364379.1 hypothetical protein [candidate division KSB1 bacterium]MDZ7402751.1 hypothetical protein [candidate division KSB1 bacterium]